MTRVVPGLLVAVAVMAVAVMAVAVMAVALLACRSSGHSADREARLLALEESEAENRRLQEDREEDLATVRLYREWRRAARAIDHVALGLPEPDEDMTPPTRDRTFCQRLPAAPPGPPPPSPADLAARFRAVSAEFTTLIFDRYGVTYLPEDLVTYRTRYLAERQLARLACLARAGGPLAARPFVDLLHDPSEATRFLAAIHAIHLGLAVDAGYDTLQDISEHGKLFYEQAGNATMTSPRLNGPYDPPISLGFDLDERYDGAMASLQRTDQGSGPRNRRAYKPVRQPQ